MAVRLYGLVRLSMWHDCWFLCLCASFLAFWLLCICRFLAYQKKKKKCLFGCTKAFKHPLLLLDFSTLVLASILGTLESKMF